MINLVHREFIVDVPLETAWQHLAKTEQWPIWAKHIRRIDLVPPGELTAKSTPIVHLTNGMKSKFKVTEFDLLRTWTWAGPVLWLKVQTHLSFELVDKNHTKLIWIWGCEGFGESIVGRVLAIVVNKQWDVEIPHLKDELVEGFI